MTGVRDLHGVAPGLFIDGGVSDYHLNTVYTPPGAGVVLFPHYQERICGTWFDRYVPNRRVRPEILADVLQIYPSAAFVASLPFGKIPDRQDFIDFAEDPDERIRRWWKAFEQGEVLAQEFREDVASGAIAERLDSLE